MWVLPLLLLGGSDEDREDGCRGRSCHGVCGTRWSRDLRCRGDARSDRSNQPLQPTPPPKAPSCAPWQDAPNWDFDAPDNPLNDWCTTWQNRTRPSVHDGGVASSSKNENPRTRWRPVSVVSRSRQGDIWPGRNDTLWSSGGTTGDADRPDTRVGWGVRMCGVGNRGRRSCFRRQRREAAGHHCAAGMIDGESVRVSRSGRGLLKFR
jgi:hypothetical protein